MTFLFLFQADVSFSFQEMTVKKDQLFITDLTQKTINKVEECERLMEAEWLMGADIKWF